METKNPPKKKYLQNWNIICTATIKSSDEDDDFTESWWRKKYFFVWKINKKEFNACDRECDDDEIQRSWEFFCLFKKNKKFVYQERIMTHEIVVQIFWARLRPEIFVWIYKFSNDFCERERAKKSGEK